MRAMLAFLFATIAAPAFAGPASDAVMVFYSPIGTVSDPALRDRFIDPALTKFKQDDKLSSGGAEIGCIDFALAIDAQDMDEGEVARTLKLSEDVNGDEATVTASFRLFPGDGESDRKILWSLKKVGGAWKVSDIAQANGTWRLSEFDCT